MYIVYIVYIGYIVYIAGQSDEWKYNTDHLTIFTIQSNFQHTSVNVKTRNKRRQEV